MIVFSEGSKGGTGKSLVSAILLDHFIAKGETPVLIETDTSNPDVYKSYKEAVAKAFAISTDDADGWATFLNTIDENRDYPIVVNSGARNQESIDKFGETLKELELPMKTFWVINKEKDSVILLKNYLEVIPAENVVVVKNRFFGENFDEYDASKTSQKISQVISIPKALDAAITTYYSKRIPLHLVPENLKFGERLLFKSWLNEVRKAFDTVLVRE